MSAQLPVAGGDEMVPLPTMASIGSRDGQTVLLDLERAGALCLQGDRLACRELMNHLALELAHNGWSDGLLVPLVGWGADLTVLDLDRLAHVSSNAAVTGYKPARQQRGTLSVRCLDPHRKRAAQYLIVNGVRFRRIEIERWLFLMTQGNPSNSGRALRRRVRQVTVGVVGAAALATAGITVGLAHATTDQVAATDSSTVSTNTGSEPRTTQSSSPSSGSSSSTVKAPTQAPSAGRGMGPPVAGRRSLGGGLHCR